MKIHLLLLLGLVALIPACHEIEVNKTRAATLSRALATAPYLVDVKKMFPRSSLTFRNFTATGGDIIIESVVNDRYYLTIHFPAAFAADNKSVTSYGEPGFQLNEITLVNPEDGRLHELHYGEQIRFGKDEWKRVVDANGDFMAAGIKLRQNDPVAGIEYVWKSIDEQMATTNVGITSEWKPRADPDCAGR